MGVPLTASIKDITHVAGCFPSKLSRSLSINLVIPKETADHLKINSLRYGNCSCAAARGLISYRLQVYKVIGSRNDPCYSKEIARHRRCVSGDRLSYICGVKQGIRS
jgi:hypothetical protein